MYKPRFFTLEELCHSETAEKYHIDNFPSFEITEHLNELTEKVLDPLRLAWGSAVRARSGYRCPKVNSLVGGSSTSAHLLGYAADLEPMKGNIDSFIKFAILWFQKTHTKFDQIIDERDNYGNRWLHIGLYNQYGQQRGQILNLVKV